MDDNRELLISSFFFRLERQSRYELMYHVKRGAICCFFFGWFVCSLAIDNPEKIVVFKICFFINGQKPQVVNGGLVFIADLLAWGFVY